MTALAHDLEKIRRARSHAVASGHREAAKQLGARAAQLAIQELTGQGLSLWLEGGRIVIGPPSSATPPVVELINDLYPDLVFALSTPPDFDAEMALQLQLSPICVCRACTHFESLPTSHPDGWCSQYRQHGWADQPRFCPIYVTRPPAVCQ